MLNVAVLFGGKSPEHDISIITGVLTLNAVDDYKFNVIPVYISKENKYYTGDVLKSVENYENLDYGKLKEVTFLTGDNKLYYKEKKKLKEYGVIGCAILCCHGLNGEDGTVSSILKLSKIPCTSCSVVGNALGINKIATKNYLNGIKVGTLPFYHLEKRKFSVDKYASIEDIENSIEYPMIVKPSRLGSSIGITKATDRRDLVKGIELALKYDDDILIEKALEDFIEINCAAYRNKFMQVEVSNLERPILSNKFYSFDEKYLVTGSEEDLREFPAKLSKKLTNKIKNYTKEIYEKFFLSGIVRIDFLVKGESVYVNELNTIPGSLAFYLFCNSMGDFTKLLDELIEVAIIEERHSQLNSYNYNSSVLNSRASGSKKMLKK